MKTSSTKRFRQWLEFVALSIVGRVIVLLPAGLSVNLGALAGIVIGRLLPIRGTVIRENLRIAFGDSISAEEHRRLFLESYKSLCMMAVEFFYIQYGPVSWTDKRVMEVEGKEHFEKLEASGRPYMGISGHMGNWELAGAWLRHLKPISPLSKRIHNPYVQDSIEKSRRRHGLEIIWIPDPQILSKLSAAFSNRDRVVNIMIDQDAGASGVFVPFFGRLASTTPTPAMFALRKGMAIVPSFLIRLGPTRHKLIICKPILPEDVADDGGDMAGAVRKLTARMTAQVEDMVRLYPAQYFWFHRRWKSQPDMARAEREKRRERRREQHRAPSAP